MVHHQSVANQFFTQTGINQLAVVLLRTMIDLAEQLSPGIEEDESCRIAERCSMHIEYRSVDPRHETRAIHQLCPPFVLLCFLEWATVLVFAGTLSS